MEWRAVRRSLSRKGLQEGLEVFQLYRCGLAAQPAREALRLLRFYPQADEPLVREEEHPAPLEQKAIWAAGLRNAGGRA